MSIYIQPTPEVAAKINEVLDEEIMTSRAERRYWETRDMHTKQFRVEERRVQTARAEKAETERDLVKIYLKRQISQAERKEGV